MAVIMFGRVTMNPPSKSGVVVYFRGSEEFVLVSDKRLINTRVWMFFIQTQIFT